MTGVLRRGLGRIRGTRRHGPGTSGPPTLGHGDERSEWFWTHYRDAADTTLRVLRDVGMDLEGLRVADIGCGEGITDLAIAVKGRTAELVGYDLHPADSDRLLAEARREGAVKELPEGLRFEVSEPTVIPAPDSSFDVVLSWSAFEHIQDPPAVMAEIARIMRPDAAFMLQLWPFYHSEHGSHLWHWFPEGFAQFRHTDEEITRRVRADEANSDLGDLLLREYGTLNRATLDSLGDAVRAAGMRVARVEPMAGAVSVPAEAAHLPLSHVSISGVILIAVRA